MINKTCIQVLAMMLTVVGGVLAEEGGSGLLACYAVPFVDEEMIELHMSEYSLSGDYGMLQVSCNGIMIGNYVADGTNIAISYPGVLQNTSGSEVCIYAIWGANKVLGEFSCKLNSRENAISHEYLVQPIEDSSNEEKGDRLIVIQEGILRVVNNDGAVRELSVYDMRGRRVGHSVINKSTDVAIKLPSGVYIAEVEMSDGNRVREKGWC